MLVRCHDVAVGEAKCHTVWVRGRSRVAVLLSADTSTRSGIVWVPTTQRVGTGYYLLVPTAWVGGRRLLAVLLSLIHPPDRTLCAGTGYYQYWVLGTTNT